MLMEKVYSQSHNVTNLLIQCKNKHAQRLCKGQCCGARGIIGCSTFSRYLNIKRLHAFHSRVGEDMFLFVKGV